MESDSIEVGVPNTKKGKLWQISEDDIPHWLERLNTTDLVLLVVGNSFFNITTGWHDIRVYRFARAFEALGFTPLVMCRWTTAATEVAGIYDGIAFRRLTKPRPLIAQTMQPGNSDTRPANNHPATDNRNTRLRGAANADESDHSSCESSTSFPLSVEPNRDPQEPPIAPRLRVRDQTESLGNPGSVNSVLRFPLRLARVIIRLLFCTYRLARAVRNRALGAARRIVRIARSRTISIATRTLRISRNRTMRAVTSIVIPWARYFNPVFSGDFKLEAQPLRPSFIYAADLNTLLAASRLAREHSVPLIYDSHEYFLSHSAHRWMSPARRFIDKLTCRFLEARLVPRTHRLISVSDGLVERFSRRFPSVKCLCVRNLPLTAAIRPRNDRIRVEVGIRAETRIALYIGFITAGRGISELLQAASHLPDDIVIVFLGGGVTWTYGAGKPSSAAWLIVRTFWATCLRTKC